MTERRAQRIPTPPTMHNRGYYTASICEIVRWLGERAEGARRQPVRRLPGGRAAGGRHRRCAACAPRRRASTATARRAPTTPSPPTSPRGSRSWPRGRAGCSARRGASGSRSASPNPQLFALGVKELWEVKRPLDAVIHTLGWPLPTDAFGGSFMYPLGPSQVALGLVVGLDYHDASLDVHELLQRMKLHPLFRRQLEGGQLLEWGAKTIPEGGYYALPDAPERRRRAVRGRHRWASSTCRRSRASTTRCSRGCTRRARRSRRSRRGDVSAARARGLRPAGGRAATSWPTCTAPGTCGSRSRTGSTLGGVKAGLMTVTGGRFPGGRIAMEEDARTGRTVEPRPRRFTPDGTAHVQQAGRGVQVGQRDPRHDPLAPPRRPRRHAGGRRLLLARLPRRRLRAGGRRAPGQRRPTASTARPPTCSARAGRRARAAAGRSTARCKRCPPASRSSSRRPERDPVESRAVVEEHTTSSTGPGSRSPPTRRRRSSRTRTPLQYCKPRPPANIRPSRHSLHSVPTMD